MKLTSKGILELIVNLKYYLITMKLLKAKKLATETYCMHIYQSTIKNMKYTNIKTAKEILAIIMGMEEI